MYFFAGRLLCYEKYKQTFTAEVQRRSAEMSVREAKEEALGLPHDVTYRRDGMVG